MHFFNFQPKILLIYLHNDADAFSQFFCSFLSKTHTKYMLETKFLFLGLDSHVQFDTSALKAVISSHNDVNSIQTHISQKDALLLFIVPLEETNYVFTYLHGDIDSEDVLLTMIEAAIEFARLEVNCIDAYGNSSRELEDVLRSGCTSKNNAQTLAVANFVRNFEQQFGTEHVNFECCSLQEAINKSCLVENKSVCHDLIDVHMVIPFYYRFSEESFCFLLPQWHKRFLQNILSTT